MEVVLDVNWVVIRSFGSKLSQNESSGSEDHFPWVTFPFPAARDQKILNIARKPSKIQGKIQKLRKIMSFLRKRQPFQRRVPCVFPKEGALCLPKDFPLLNAGAHRSATQGTAETALDVGDDT